MHDDNEHAEHSRSRSDSSGSEHPAEVGLSTPPPMARPGREPGSAWRLLGVLRALRESMKTEGLKRWSWSRLKRWALVAWLPFLIFTMSFTAYALLSWNRFTKPSVETHFAFLAHTFLDRLSCDGVEGEGFHRPDQGEARPRPKPRDAPTKGSLRCERAQRFEMPIHPARPSPYPELFYKGHQNDWASYEVLTLKGEDHEELAGFFTGERYKGLREHYEEFRGLDKQHYMLKRSMIDRGYTSERRYFMSFPPMPAVLMAPVIAMADRDDVDLRDPTKLGINDVHFTVFFAALNVMLCFLLLEHLRRLGISHRSRRDNTILTFLYGFATNVLWCSILGQVWFTALIVGATFTFLYLFAAIDTRHPLLAGLFLGCAMASRTPLAFSFVFFAWFLFFPNGRLRRGDWGEMFKKGVLFSIPILAIGVWLMWMNQVRYANPFEFGHTYLAGGRRPSTLNYGLFNYHFLSKNLTAALTMLPRLQPYEPYVIISKHGMSLFVTSPFLVYLFAYRSGWRSIDRKWFWALVVSVLAVAVPGLFYQNTGWTQFGFRFSLDYTPYLVLLLALNRRRIGPLFQALVFVGFLINSFGAVTVGRSPKYYEENWVIDPDTPRKPRSK